MINFSFFPELLITQLAPATGFMAAIAKAAMWCTYKGSDNLNKLKIYSVFAHPKIILYPVIM